jgi:ABC-type glycerol-3-phosphate transport system substrate-binding protein
MTTDINTLIDFFKKYTPNTDIKGEVEEQDDTSATTSTGGGGGSVPKWSDSYVTTRGKANMLGRTGEKWNTGINRGAANQIW